MSLGDGMTGAAVGSDRWVTVGLEEAEHLVFTGRCDRIRRVTPLVPTDLCDDPDGDRATRHDVIAHVPTAFLLDTLTGDDSAGGLLDDPSALPHTTIETNGTTMSDQRHPGATDTHAAEAAVSELRLVLTVDDHARAVAFYRDQLGLQQLEQYEERGGHVTILSAGRATLELNDQPYAEFIDEVEVGRRVPERVRVAFQVPDSGATTERLVANGARLVAPPTRTPWNSRNARVRDPDGVQLTLFTEIG